MIIKKRKRIPFYKQFLKLRKNIQNRSKLLKLNRRKWNNLKRHCENQQKFFRKFKIFDQLKLTSTKFAIRGNSFKKQFRNRLRIRKTIHLFYGKFKKKYFKKKIKNILKKKNKNFNLKNFNYHVIEAFEKRLDVVVYRAKFALHVENARQIISHGHILVNNKRVNEHSYLLKPGDLVSVKPIKKSFSLIKHNINKSSFWPLPPNFLLINYNTLQIYYGITELENLTSNFNLNLKIDYLTSSKHL